LLFIGTKTRQKKFIHGLRKTPKIDHNKPKKLLNLGIVQSTITNKKDPLPISTTATSTSNSVSSLVSADYESSSE